MMYGSGSSADAHAAEEAGGVVIVVEARHDDAQAGVGRVDELAVADVDAGVGGRAAGGVGPLEEDDVAGLQVAAADVGIAVAELVRAGAAHAVAELPVDVVDHAGAVEAGGGGAAVDVAVVICSSTAFIFCARRLSSSRSFSTFLFIASTRKLPFLLLDERKPMLFS